MESSGRNQQVIYSATTFRQLLNSLARPGKINALEYPSFPGAPPSFYSQARATDLPVNLYALGALLTLLDGEVSFIIAANGQWQPANSPVVHMNRTRLLNFKDMVLRTLSGMAAFLATS